MKKLMALILSFISLSIFSLSASPEESLREKANVATQKLLEVQHLMTDHRQDRTAIKEAVTEATKVLNEVLNNPDIKDSNELEILSPMAKAFGELIKNIGADFKDPQNTSSLKWSEYSEKWYQRILWKILGYSAFVAAGIGRDLGSAFSFLKRNKNRKWRLSIPQVTPLLGADSKRNGTLKWVIKKLGFALKTEFQEARTDSTQVSQAVKLFQEVVYATTRAEPMVAVKTHLSYMLGLVVIAETLSVMGVEFWYERTELGADIFAGVYNLLAFAGIYVRYVSSGMPVARMNNVLRNRVNLRSNKMSFSCRLGLRRLAEQR